MAEITRQKAPKKNPNINSATTFSVSRPHHPLHVLVLSFGMNREARAACAQRARSAREARAVRNHPTPHDHKSRPQNAAAFGAMWHHPSANVRLQHTPKMAIFRVQRSTSRVQRARQGSNWALGMPPIDPECLKCPENTIVMAWGDNLFFCTSFPQTS